MIDAQNPDLLNFDAKVGLDSAGAANPGCDCDGAIVMLIKSKSHWLYVDYPEPFDTGRCCKGTFLIVRDDRLSCGHLLRRGEGCERSAFLGQLL